jgi:predicted nuclease of restriction endonuclease-like (RecB) superfamily
MKKKEVKAAPFYQRVCRILESARSNVARSVNTTQVVSNWLIGREIVEEEQQGERRAGYGERLLEDLAQRLQKDFGAGYSLPNLKYVRQFYKEYQLLIDGSQIGHALRGQSWEPGRLHPNLSWTQYRTLLRVDRAEARSFYEIESLNNNWSM